MHDVEEQCRLAGRATELASTERGVPGTLGLIEHDDMLVRWLRAIDTVAQKTHERLDGALGPLPRHAQAASLFICITGERLAHDVDQRQIAAPLVAPNTAFKPHSVLPAPGMPVTNST